MLEVFQSTILLLCAIPVAFIEWACRIALFPINVYLLIIMQLLGLKDTLQSQAWHTMWDYGAFWKIRGQFYITYKVVKHLDPNC